MLTSGEGAFFVQMLRESYTLQEDLYRFVIERYDTFDVLIWTWNVKLFSLWQQKDGLDQAKKEIIRI